MHKTPRDIIAKKAAGQKISVITAYDYSLATLCDKAGVEFCWLAIVQEWLF